MGFAMARSRSRRRWSWLLCLGLLFAFAQTAANAHAISHFGQDAPRTRDGAIVHAQCDLCLIGAAIGGAAPPPEPLSACHPALSDVAVAAGVALPGDAAPALAYRSRAPPLARH